MIVIKITNINVKNSRIKESSVIREGDSFDIKIIIDFSGLGNYSSAEKFIDLIMSDGTKSFKSLGFDEIVEYYLDSSNTIEGVLQIQPYVRDHEGNPAYFAIFNIPVGNSLSVTVDTSVLTKDIIHYLNTLVDSKLEYMFDISSASDGSILEFDVIDGVYKNKSYVLFNIADVVEVSNI